MFGSIHAVPDSMKIPGTIVDVHDVNGGVQSYIYDGKRWADFLRPNRPKASWDNHKFALG